MIPKRIYQIWLKRNPDVIVPQLTQEFIGNVKQWCSTNGYEYILIDNDSEVFRECAEKSSFFQYWMKRTDNKKYVAALSDYIRLYVLYKYGGIYLDTDVRIIEGFNDFLDNRFFLCVEPLYHDHQELFRRFDIGTIGSEPGNKYISIMLEYLDTAFTQAYFSNRNISKESTVSRLKSGKPIYRLWVALPDLWPFVLQELMHMDIEVITENRKLKSEDERLEVYTDTFFSRDGEYVKHCYHTMWRKDLDGFKQ